MQFKHIYMCLYLKVQKYTDCNRDKKYRDDKKGKKELENRKKKIFNSTINLYKF